MSAGATIALLGMFGATAMKLGRRTSLLVTLLLVLYAVLYLILESTDHALLAGATLSFLALALTMYLTRDENWYGGRSSEPAGPGVGTSLWQKLSEAAEPAKPPAPPPGPPAAG
jgi:inner membrane protein